MDRSYPDYYESLRKLSGRLSRELRSPMSAFTQLTGAATTEGALSSKFKQLIALAIGVTVRCDGCTARLLLGSLSPGIDHLDEVAPGVAKAALKVHALFLQSVIGFLPVRRLFFRT